MIQQLLQHWTLIGFNEHRKSRDLLEEPGYQA